MHLNHRTVHFVGLGILVALCHALFPASAYCQALKLPFVFTDHAVLQRDIPVPVWGQAVPDATVTVAFADQSKTATADRDGKWSLKLDPLMTSAQGHDFTVTSGGSTFTAHDVLVGEVWLCSGQSNMEKPVGAQPGQRPTVDADNVIKAADHPTIRFLLVPKSGDPKVIDKSAWSICTPETLDLKKKKPSAVAYFFGLEIQSKLNVPIGLISDSWGGTRIEPWTTPEALDANPALADFAKAAHAWIGNPTTRGVNTTPSGLYESMIRPVVPFAIRGALWYQGEQNVMSGDRSAYADKMVSLVSGWRTAWTEGDFPFYYVQLAPFTYTHLPPPLHLSAEELPCVWEAQAKAMSLIPNSGMAVITDLVDRVSDIHPTRKKEVGQRLALWALAKTYGFSDTIYSGPLYSSSEFQGDHAILHFTQVGSGLASRDGKPLTDFTVAGEDGIFHPATAEIDKDTVVLTSENVLSLRFARFGWSEIATPNFMNTEGLPASPFRTDMLPIPASPTASQPAATTRPAGR
jgi:sialate O-acetylesterase